MGFFSINCDEATKICNKNQYKEASFFEKVKLVLHMAICKHCRQYSAQNTILTKACDKHLKQEVPFKKLTPVEKADIEKKVNAQKNNY